MRQLPILINVSEKVSSLQIRDLSLRRSRLEFNKTHLEDHNDYYQSERVISTPHNRNHANQKFLNFRYLIGVLDRGEYRVPQILAVLAFFLQQYSTVYIP